MKRCDQIKLFISAAMLLASSAAQSAQPIPVGRLAAAPVIDGKLDDWKGSWQTVHVKPATDKDKKNYTGELDIEVQAGVANDEIFIAVRWPDKKANLEYKPWKWKKKKYKRSKERDDMFAVRFDMAGDYNACMVEDADYDVDVWLWSAGRSNKLGYANDMWQRISRAAIENAAEYETSTGGRIYIKKYTDEGQPGFKNNKPELKKNQGNKLPGIVFNESAEGSVADVAAKGIWNNGFWTLELRRKLDTGHSDDVSLADKANILGQMAVFNKGYAEHKSVSPELLFDFSNL